MLSIMWLYGARFQVFKALLGSVPPVVFRSNVFNQKVSTSELSGLRRGLRGVRSCSMCAGAFLRWVSGGTLKSIHKAGILA